MKGRTAQRQLCNWMARDGNWRFKALLAAELDEAPWTAEEIGGALRHLARKPDVKRHHLSKRYAGREPPADGPAAVERDIRPLSYPDEFAEPAAARKLADNGDYDERDLERGVDLDDYMGRLLTSEALTEKDVLWREQLLDTVIAGAEEAQIARDASTLIEVNTQQGDHPVRGDDIFATKIAQGASIPFDEEDWSTNAWKTEKWALGAYVTEELIDQALVDVIEANVRKLGRAVENSLNRVFMNELVDNADSSNDVETNAGTSAPFGTDLDQLLIARNNALANKFGTPDTIVMHNDFQLGITAGNNDQNLLFANRAGNMDVLGDAEFPAGLFGLSNAFVVPDGPYNGGNNWGYDTDGHFGAVLYPRDLMFTYLRRDVETKDFDDPIRDLEGANVRAEFDAVWGQTSAAARIKN